ncbi:MAG: helix-turn-helix transcriptional regulator [Oscillospiraceae bacterium]|nr:helix-turn-helix transcriptional regulator [Oscillospiraceae bacterium]
MDLEKLKRQIGINIATHRKHVGLTQAGLAEKLNYSDKAVSKWERGESIPDALTLIQLAELFQISVDSLLSDPNVLPGNPGTLEKAMTHVSEKALNRKANKNVILGLSSTLVWFVALLIFVVISSFDLPYSWIAFFYAVPVNAIVLLSLRSAWHDFRWNRILISFIVWGFLVSIYATLLVFLRFNMWKLFLLGIPGEIAIFLWFRLFRTGKEEHHADE